MTGRLDGRPKGEDVLGVEILGVYDGVSVWLYPDGRIENRWATDAWTGSDRWAFTEGHIAEHLGALTEAIRKQWPTDPLTVSDEDGPKEDG